MKTKKGFTLVEVLLTLTIVGVVAALIIPTLMMNIKGAQFKTAFKKSISILDQAVAYNIHEDNTDFSNLYAENDTTLTDQMKEKTQLMSNLLLQRVKGSEVFEYEGSIPVFGENGGLNGLIVPIKDAENSDFKAYRFADGIVFAYNVGAKNCTSLTSENCNGFIDVNGQLGPNEEVMCTNYVIPNANKGDETEDCKVETESIKDVFPVRIYKQTVVPATDAAKEVLGQK